jgi:hypothetical protein
MAPLTCLLVTAEYVAAVFSGCAVLPNVAERFAWLAQFEAKLKQMRYFEEKYHYLGDGDDQWEYCRFLARESGLIREGQRAAGGVDNNSCCSSSAERVSRYIRLMQEIYEDNIAHRPVYPGAPDSYRERRYYINR